MIKNYSYSKMTSTNVCTTHSFSTNSFLSLAHKCEANMVIADAGDGVLGGWAAALHSVSVLLVCPFLSSGELDFSFSLSAQ